MLSLVDTAFDPLQDTPEYSLTAELLCTNRHLAENLPAGTRLDFERPGPVAQASLLAPPTPQSLPRLSGPSRWRLVSQLSLNHLSLVEGPDALDALRELLHLHNLRDEAGSRRLVDGLVELTCERVLGWVGEDAWRGWRNGLEVRIRLDPLHFAGTSTVLFSAVLAQFFSSMPHLTASCARCWWTPTRRFGHGSLKPANPSVSELAPAREASSFRVPPGPVAAGARTPRRHSAGPGKQPGRGGTALARAAHADLRRKPGGAS